MEILYILFGWLLGLISPIVTDKMRKHFQLKEVKKAFVVELNGLAKRLIASSFQMTSRIGHFDASFLHWFIPLYNKYNKVSSDPEFPKELENVILKEHKDFVQQWDKRLKSFYKGGIGLKKYSLPYIRSRMHELQHFDSNFSVQILNILGKVDMLNENIEEAKYFLDKTFDSSLSESNYAIINENKETAYLDILEQVKFLVSVIDALVPT